MSKRPSYRWAAILATGIALLAVLSSSLAGADDDITAPLAQTDVVRVYYSDRTQRNQLLLSFKAQLLETHYEDGYHVMQLTAHEIEQLARAGIRVQADPQWAPQHTLTATKPSTQANGIPGYPCYRTVEETFAAAQQIAQGYAQLATWEDIGDSWEKRAGLGGYDIMVLRLTNRDIPGPKPTLFVNGAIHAREYTTAELVTRFAETLVENYGTDADVTWILDYHQVNLILQANPDGRKLAEAGRSWRKNTNRAYCTPWSNGRGADLNRNFGFQWNCCGGSSDDECAWDYHGPVAASEPEIQALQNHMAAIFPDQRGPGLQDAAPDDATGILIDVHSYGELILWPWNFSDRTAPNAVQLQTLGRKLAYWNGYTPQQAIGLYPADGVSDDYAYGQFGVAAYTMELGTRFFQSCDDFESTILPNNLPTLLYAAKVARAPYIIPSGPDSIQLSLSDQEVPAGAPVALRATIDDTRYHQGNGSEPVQDIVAAEWYADTPPWVDGAQAMALTASDGAWDSSAEDVEAVIDTAGWSQGRHILFVRGQDADGNWGATSALYLTLSGGLNSAPVAAFSQQCDNLSCQFDASDSYDPDGSIVAYAWTFGDGATDDVVTARHTYAAPGAYHVALTVTDDDSAAVTYSQTITVPQNLAPSAAFTYRCSGLSCAFDGSSSYDPDGSIAGYAWAFGDGATTGGVTATHRYDTARTYPVTLAVTDTEGATATQTRHVGVGNPPQQIYLPYVHSGASEP